MLHKEYRPVPLPTRTVEPGRVAVATARQAVIPAGGKAPAMQSARAPVPKRSATIVNARLLPSTVKPRRRWVRPTLISVAVTAALAVLGGLAWLIIAVVTLIVAHLAQIVAALIVAALLFGWFGLGRVGMCPGIHCPGCKCGGR